MHPQGVISLHFCRTSVLVSLLGVAAAGFIPAGPAAAAGFEGITVHSPEEVLARWTSATGDRLFFESPEGERWELVTDIRDPVIRNSGAGSFFPADPEWVASALAAITFPGGLHQADVFILPFPRREVLDSNAGAHTVYLSPGVVPLDVKRTHALVAHEMGHLVHRAFLPDGDLAGWAEYRVLRGIEDTGTYFAGAEHKNRPHEIFAEDFRSLFGGEEANYSGSIENQDIAAPEEVHALRDFFLSLVDPARLAGLLPLRPLRIFPNPSPGPVRFAMTGAAVETEAGYRMEVFDVRGRLTIRCALSSQESPGWDGRDAGGNRVATGLYFVRLQQDGQTWAGKVLVRSQ